MKKRLASLLMALVMVVGVLPTAAFAAKEPEGKETIKYVSLGDSMTNGYGLTQYGNNGFESYGRESYAVQFAEWLEEEGYADTVVHSEFALSGMRAEDLHFILEYPIDDPDAAQIADDAWDEEAWEAKFKVGDWYTWYQFTNNGSFWQNVGREQGNMIGSTNDAAKKYQTAVAEADIISMGLGNSNWGVFLLGRIMNALGFMGGSPDKDSWIELEDALRDDFPEDMAAQVMEYSDKLRAELVENETLTSALSVKKVDAMANAIIYTLVSYMLNYGGAIDRIVELNPDAEIIIVGLMNTMNGMEFRIDENTVVDMGEYMYDALSIVNAYLTALPTYMQTMEHWTEATFLYAEAPNVEAMVDKYADYIDDPNYPTIRERFITEIVGDNGDSMVWGLLSPMVKGLVSGATLVPITREDVEDYEAMSDVEKATYAASTVSGNPQRNTAISYAIYLAFEDAVVASCDPEENATMSLEGMLALQALSADLFNGVVGYFTDNIESASAAKVDAAAETVADLSNRMLTKDMVLGLLSGDEAIADQIYTGLACAAVAGSVGNMTPEQVATAYEAGDPTITPYVEGAKDTVKDTIEDMDIPGNVQMLCMLLALPETLSAGLQSDEMIFGLLNLYARCLIGNGLGAHPSAGGHDALTKAVTYTYANEHTASDETVENLMEAVKFLLANYETVYRYAYQYAKGQGYIAQANELLNEIENEIGAIDVESLGLSDMKTQILGDVQALRTLVSESPEHADAVSNFYALCDELIADLAALEAVAGQAGEELYEAAVALQAKLEEALTEALKNADAQIRAAYEKVVEEITALAEQYGPEAEAFIREWLYENPKELLETILAYGKDIDAMLNHWNYHLQMILGPAWNAYGEELMAALEEVLALLGEEAAELSAQAAKELMAYIESLDLDTQIEEIADALMNGSVTIGGETLAELEEIAADLEKDLETNVKAVIDALETVAYGADSQAAKAEIEKVIELVKATEAELKGEIALIEQDIAALAALLEESYNGATDEIPDIAREIRKLLDDPMAVLELDGEDLAHVRAVLETLCETLKEIQTSAEAISKLTTDITNAAKTINTAILTMNGELKTAVDGIETTLTEAGADAETLLAETYEAIEAFVTTTADTVYTDASALMAVCELKLTAAVNELVAAIENVVSKAVSGSVKGDCTSVYTAIGDEVEGLAEALGLTAGELSEKTALVTVNFEGEELSAFVNAQIAGMIADTVEMNEDLVNILNGGYGATILAEIEKLGIDLKAETATLDWGKYLDEKAIGVKNETLAGIAQVLMDHEALVETYTIDVGEIISPIISEQIGLEITVNCVAQIPVAELAIAAVDNLLYAYVESAAAFAAELEAVRAVAPEAEVVVLGLTDAAEELQVKIGNMTLDLAEYEEVLNAFVSAHYFAYALVNGENTTFVADAEAIAEALSVDVAGHVWNAYEKKDDETHYLVCSVCGAKGETEAHTLVDNKCVCGYEKVVEEEDRPSGGSSRPKRCPWCKTNTCHSAAFTDLDLDAWYHEYTDYVLCKGLMNGMGGTIFAPNATATRAMIITTLYRMEGSPAVTGEITFSDVAADTWYSDAVVWATQNGIVNGFADGTFAPMQNVTREQIAAIFFRLAELKGVKTDKAAELSPAYDDAGDVGAWAVKYMQWAVGEGLMKGRSTHMLVPAGETTRAETAALLQRWCEEIAD